jgi:hypothetical protein
MIASLIDYIPLMVVNIIDYRNGNTIFRKLIILLAQFRFEVGLENRRLFCRYFGDNIEKHNFDPYWLNHRPNYLHIYMHAYVRTYVSYMYKPE